MRNVMMLSNPSLNTAYLAMLQESMVIVDGFFAIEQPAQIQSLMEKYPKAEWILVSSELEEPGMEAGLEAMHQNPDLVWIAFAGMNFSMLSALAAFKDNVDTLAQLKSSVLSETRASIVSVSR